VPGEIPGGKKNIRSLSRKKLLFYENRQDDALPGIIGARNGEQTGNKLQEPGEGEGEWEKWSGGRLLLSY